MDSLTSSMAGSRCLNKVIGVLVLCLLALFSLVLPSFLALSKTKEDRFIGHKIVFAECISFPEKVLGRLSLAQIESCVLALSQSQ